jgi:hypothetical protein
VIMSETSGRSPIIFDYRLSALKPTPNLLQISGTLRNAWLQLQLAKARIREKNILVFWHP